MSEGFAIVREGSLVVETRSVFNRQPTRHFYEFQAIEEPRNSISPLVPVDDHLRNEVEKIWSKLRGDDVDLADLQFGEAGRAAWSLIGWRQDFLRMPGTMQPASDAGGSSEPVILVRKPGDIMKNIHSHIPNIDDAKLAIARSIVDNFWKMT